MNKELEDAIKQLKDLKIDRESFLNNDKEDDKIYLKDIKAIETVLKELERLQEENSQYKRIKDIADSVTKKEIDEAIKRANKEFIAKKKIIEKIIIDKSKLNNCTNSILANVYEARIEFGEELLEGK